MFGHLLRYFSFCKKDLLVFHPESDYSDNLRKAFSFTKGWDLMKNGMESQKTKNTIIRMYSVMSVCSLV